MENRLISPVNESRTRRTERLVEDLKMVVQRAEQKAVERAKAADKVVRDHPYQTMGIVLGLGVLIGVLARRRQAMPRRIAASPGS